MLMMYMKVILRIDMKFLLQCLGKSMSINVVAEQTDAAD